MALQTRHTSTYSKCIYLTLQQRTVGECRPPWGCFSGAGVELALTVSKHVLLVDERNHAGGNADSLYSQGHLYHGNMNSGSP